jgi:hypothetical protein
MKRSRYPANLDFRHPFGIPDKQQPVSQELHHGGKVRPKRTMLIVIGFSQPLPDTGEKPIQKIVEEFRNGKIRIYLVAESRKAGEVKYSGYRLFFLTGRTDITKRQHRGVESLDNFIVNQRYPVLLLWRSDAGCRPVPSYPAYYYPFHFINSSSVRINKT